MVEQPAYSQDRQHLTLLQIFYYIWGAISCLWGLGGLFYVQLGAQMTRMFSGTPESENFSLMFGRLWIGMAVFSVIAFETCGVLSLIAAWQYRKHKSYWFCFGVAVINCLLVPVGTALGAFSIFVLCRPSVKALFQGQLASANKQ